MQDLWIWDNDKGKDPATPTVDLNATGFIEKDRDHSTEPRPQYAPFTYSHPSILAD